MAVLNEMVRVVMGVISVDEISLLIFCISRLITSTACFSGARRIVGVTSNSIYGDFPS